MARGKTWLWNPQCIFQQQFWMLRESVGMTLKNMIEVWEEELKAGTRIFKCGSKKPLRPKLSVSELSLWENEAKVLSPEKLYAVLHIASVTRDAYLFRDQEKLQYDKDGPLYDIAIKRLLDGGVKTDPSLKYGILDFTGEDPYWTEVQQQWDENQGPDRMVCFNCGYLTTLEGTRCAFCGKYWREIVKLGDYFIHRHYTLIHTGMFSKEDGGYPEPPKLRSSEELRDSKVWATEVRDLQAIDQEQMIAEREEKYRAYDRFVESIQGRKRKPAPEDRPKRTTSGKV